jgi:Bacterial tandem repeat domain 1
MFSAAIQRGHAVLVVDSTLAGSLTAPRGARAALTGEFILKHLFRGAQIAGLLFALGFSHTVRAGDVQFHRIDVGGCSDEETCDLHLRCWIGDSPKSQPAFAVREQESGAAFEISRSLSFDSLPVTLGCRLDAYYDDGEGNAGWEVVGMQNVEVEEEGDFYIEMEDDDGESLASVQFTAALGSMAPSRQLPLNQMGPRRSTAPVSPPAQQGSGQRLFVGVFGAGSDAHWLVSGVDSGKFNAEWNRYTPAGLRLTDMDIYVDGGARRYSGIYREGNDGHATVAAKSWADFNTAWRGHSSKGLRLIDLEIDGNGAQRTYSGVFRAIGGAYYLTPALGWDDFISKRDELTQQQNSLRLVDIASFEEGGQRYFHGVYLPGNEDHYLVRVQGWQAFVDNWTSVSQRGLRLVDIDIYGSGANRTFIGVYRGGNDGYALYAGSADDFTRKVNTLGKQGLRLLDIETYID